jgi:hypothetical protein
MISAVRRCARPARMVQPPKNPPGTADSRLDGWRGGKASADALFPQAPAEGVSAFTIRSRALHDSSGWMEPSSAADRVATFLLTAAPILTTLALTSPDHSGSPGCACGRRQRSASMMPMRTPSSSVPRDLWGRLARCRFLARPQLLTRPQPLRYGGTSLSSALCPFLRISPAYTG